MSKTPMLSFLCFCLVALPSWVAVMAQPAADAPGYQLAWYDDFDGDTLDTNKWIKIFSTVPTNNSLQAYLPDQVTVSGGNMVITSTDDPFNNFLYRSGQVFSVEEQKFGRWEVMAKLPTSRGMWPAIWLLPDISQYPWPSGGEIDIMENRGDQPFLTSSAFHYGTNPPFVHNFVYTEQETRRSGQSVDYHNSFHEYAVEWDADQLRFFIDDVHHHTVYTEDVGNFIGDSTGPMQLLINTAVGGTFLANPDGSTQWPQEMLVDYVNVYEPTGTIIETFENGDFELGTLGHWTVFNRGLEFSNVSVDHPQFGLGDGTLKLFGRFNNQDNYSGIEQGIRVLQAGDTLQATCKSYITSSDSISGSENRVLLKVDYFSKPNGRFGSSDYITSDAIVIANGSSPNNVWESHVLNSTAPPGAVSARVAVVFNQPSNEGGAAFIDDITFENQSLETVDVDADSLVIIRGVVGEGDNSNIDVSDDVRIGMNPGFTLNASEPPVWLQTIGTAPGFDPSAMTFTLESHANTVNVSQTIQLLNYSTGNLETVDVQNASFNVDAVKTIDLTGDLSEYRNASNNEVMAIMSWKTNGFTLLFPWQINIDKIGWTITP